MMLIVKAFSLASLDEHGVDKVIAIAAVIMLVMAEIRDLLVINEEHSLVVLMLKTLFIG